MQQQQHVWQEKSTEGNGEVAPNAAATACSPSASSTAGVAAESVEGTVAPSSAEAIAGSAPSASSWDAPPRPLDTSAFSVFLEELATKRPEGGKGQALDPPSAPSAPPSAVAPSAAATSAADAASGGLETSIGASSSSRGGGASEEKERSAAREREAGAASDSGSSSEDGRKGYRHKKRAGKSVRERKHGRKRRPGDVGYERRGPRPSATQTDTSSWYKVVSSCWGRDTIFIHAVRFGLFCAMAWSMNSIIFSVLRLYNSGNYPPSTDPGS